MEITSGKIQKAKKVVIYGPEGIGKSSFASQFPDPLFIDTEGSTDGMDVRRAPKPSSWEMLNNEIKEVMQQKLCKTLIIDTIDWAEQLCITSVCARFQKSGIEDFGYGNGYVYEKEEFGKFLNLLQEVVDSGINVVLTAHAQLRKFEQPDEMGSYDRWELKLGKKTGSQISPLVKEWADMVLFANYKTYAVATDKEGKKFKAQGGERVMYTSHHPCWDAKNRAGLPTEMKFEYAGIAHLFAVQPVQQTQTIQSQTSLPPVQNTVATSTPVQNAPTVQQSTEPIADLSGFETLDSSTDIPADIPKPVADLMRANNVSEADIRLVVSNRGYFPYDMKISDYPEDFINGWLLVFWDKVLQMIKENNQVPFN